MKPDPGSLILQAFYQLSPDQRLECECESNCWQWPSALGAFKPEGWDEMSQEEMFNHPTAKELRAICNALLSPWETSWYWWKNILKRNSTSHAQFWLNPERHAEEMRRAYMSGKGNEWEKKQAA